MAVPFYLPEGGADETASGSPPPSTLSSSSQSSSGASTSSSSPAGSSSASSGGSGSASQSPNTTTSATQTPMQSPLLTSEQLMMAICEVVQRYANQSAPPIFQYPPPPSPSCSVPSPSYNGGEFFFPRGRSTPRTPRTSVSFAAGEEANYYRQRQPIPQPMPPQSAPPLHHSYQPQTPHFHPHTSAAYAAHYAQYTPPPTPTTNSSSGPLGTNSQAPQLGATGFSSGATASSSTQTAMRLHRSHSDAARRSRLTSTGEDEREYQSEHETSWDEFEDRFENFTAGRERLQEFNGRIPPRKKKNKEPVPKAKPDKKEQSFTWPTVVTVFVVAMGCGFLVAR